MSYGEFISLIKVNCSDAVVEFAKELIDENTELEDDVYYLQEKVSQLEESLLRLDSNYKLCQ